MKKLFKALMMLTRLVLASPWQRSVIGKCDIHYALVKM